MSTAEENGSQDANEAQLPDEAPPAGEAQLANEPSPVDPAPAGEAQLADEAPPVDPAPPVEPAPAAEAPPVEPAPADDAPPVDPAPPVEPAPAAEAPPVDPALPVDPAAELTRDALEDFARRYATSRELTWVAEEAPAWRDPGPWFLSSLDITRSFGVMRGGIGDGPDGELWYAEEAVRGVGGSRGRWITARYEIAGARRAGGISCAVRRRHAFHEDGPLPRGLTEAPTGDVQFDQRYVLGAAGGDLANGEQPWPERLFTARSGEWPARCRDPA
jgi:hypothetical protein